MTSFRLYGIIFVESFLQQPIHFDNFSRIILNSLNGPDRNETAEYPRVIESVRVPGREGKNEMKREGISTIRNVSTLRFCPICSSELMIRNNRLELFKEN